MTAVNTFDDQMMLRALELSMQGRITAPPNPWVGCVIVKNGTIIGEGFHRAVGEHHAEIEALQRVKGDAAGATVYVTLEPCSHFGRTPPCTKALIDAKVARVVIGIQDPDPKVQGRGIAELQAAGIKVDYGVVTPDIAKCLAPYLYHRRTGLSYCVAKGAVSIDGRIAAKDGSSQWITSIEAQRDSHQLRAESQAILVGARTACIDHPRLTVRHLPIFPKNPPLRVVLDGLGHLEPPNPLLDISLAPTLIITSASCHEEKKRLWEQNGVEIAVAPWSSNKQGVDLKYVLELLGKRGILQVLVEGGGTLLGSFLDSKLIQRLSLYVGTCILGSGGVPLFGTDSIATLSEAPKLKFLETKTCGDTIRIDYSFD